MHGHKNTTSNPNHNISTPNKLKYLWREKLEPGKNSLKPVAPNDPLNNAVQITYKPSKLSNDYLIEPPIPTNN